MKDSNLLTILTLAYSKLRLLSSLLTALKVARKNHSLNQTN